MSGELETAALASGGGWLGWKRKHAEIPPGTPCANCATSLQGTYCHVCGQEAEDFHKSSWKLLIEAIESLLHLDGRMFSTLPNLVRRPGQLTRDYLDGKRASQVAPFRMFLVILLVAFFVGHLASKSGEHEAAAEGHSQINIGGATPAAREEAEAEILADPELTQTQKQIAVAAARGEWARFGTGLASDIQAQSHADADADAAGSAEAPGTAEAPGGVTTKIAGKENEAFKHWVEARYAAVKKDPERFALILEIWGHRVAILALPVSALMLTILFAFNRRYFVFDHVIFSMHSLSFQLLLLIVILLLSMVIGGAAWWLILASPVHLFLHMKGTYQRSGFGTLARMFVLFILTSVTFSLLALLWLYLGFNEMAGH